jgi:hypothetical protein
MPSRLKSLFLSALATSVLLSSCQPGDVRMPTSPTAPEAVQSSSGWQSEYTEVRSAPLVGFPKTAAVIGAAGGSLSLLGHTVTVPAGAVGAPTLFSLLQLPNGYIEVEVLALVFDPLSGLRDVGSHGFLDGKTVGLTLSYAGATNVSDPSRLLILRMLPNGTVQPLPSVVDTTAQTVTVQLEHFSRYCMAMD